MKVNPHDLRIDPPRLAAPDHLIGQLSVLAAAGAGKPARRRGAIVAGVTAGVLALGMGGAWASGTIEVPGLPKPGSTAPVDPSPPKPSDETPATDDAPEAPQPTEDGHDNGQQPDGRDKRTPGNSPEPNPGKGADADSGAGARGEAERRRPDHAVTPDAPGRSGEAGTPDSPGRSDEIAKPDGTGKPTDTGKPTEPRGSDGEKRAKQRNDPSTSTGRGTARNQRAASNADRVKEQSDG